MTDSSSVSQIRTLRRQQESRLKLKVHADKKAEKITRLISKEDLNAGEIEILIRFLENGKEIKRDNLVDLISILTEYKSQVTIQGVDDPQLVRSLRKIQQSKNSKPSALKTLQLNDIPDTNIDQAIVEVLTQPPKPGKEIVISEEDLKLQKLKLSLAEKEGIYKNLKSNNSANIKILIKLALDMINFIQDSKVKKGFGGITYKDSDFMKILVSHQEAVPLIIDYGQKIKINTLEEAHGEANQLIDKVKTKIDAFISQELLQSIAEANQIQKESYSMIQQVDQFSLDEVINKISLIRGIIIDYLNESLLKNYSYQYAYYLASCTNDSFNYFANNIREREGKTPLVRLMDIDSIRMLINELFLITKLNTIVHLPENKEAVAKQVLSVYFLEVHRFFGQILTFSNDKQDDTAKTIIHIEEMVFTPSKNSFWDQAQIDILLQNKTISQFRTQLRSMVDSGGLDNGVQKVIDLIKDFINYLSKSPAN